MIPTDHRGQIRKDSLQKVVPSTIADTMLHFSFPPVEIRGAYNFKNKHQEKKYRQLFEDIKRTYPLSQIVLHEVRSVDGAIDSTYWTKAQVKAYLKWYEKQIFNTYIDTLKSLNIRQIQLFIKLIDRETGNSPYKLIKKYRGGLDAFLWQLAANAMMLNLKREYDPAEEAIIEDIVTKFY
ncbi:MAG: DUF4294 domain-containing protein [Prolixibacteraceae bacterium]|jgi:hypothetical protein|nr:DUF4294 domain-containing protein [Prolixibacteraceae bacterium]